MVCYVDSLQCAFYKGLRLRIMKRLAARQSGYVSGWRVVDSSDLCI